MADTAGHFPGAEDEKHRHDTEPGHDVGGQPGRDSSKLIPNMEWITSRSIFELVTLHIDNIDMLAVSHCWIIYQMWFVTWDYFYFCEMMIN